MTLSDGTTSIWTHLGPGPVEHAPLRSHTSADACVVGAGITGLTTAYLLARHGLSVVVLDQGPVAGGETARTTAHLTCALDDRFMHIERHHGAAGAQRAAESHDAAIDTIESIVSEHGIECDFERVPGYLVEPPGSSGDLLEYELAAVRRAGLDDAELVDRVPYDGFEFGPALRFPNQAQFNPLRYMAGLDTLLTEIGGRIFTGTHVTDIDSVGGCAHIDTSDDHRVTARFAIVATNSPINKRVAIHTKQAAYRTYVVSARVPTDSVPNLLLWDTDDPYHYVRVHHANDSDHLIVGGEDHKTGQADDYLERFARLERWTRERFPMVEDFDLHWSGQIMEPVDDLAFIGRSPADGANVFLATGDSGNGMTHGTIAALLIADLVAGRSSPWESIYRPSRPALSALGTFAKENLNAVVQYTDRLGRGNGVAGDDLAPGMGLVCRDHGQWIAVHRTQDGTLTRRTAICPHLGCVVQWNGLEQSWDCPCHGSRFAASDGRVLNGPSTAGLEPVE